MPFTFTLPAGQAQVITVQYLNSTGQVICDDLIAVECDSILETVNCDSIAVSYLELPQSGDSCCYRISIENNNKAGVLDDISVNMFSDQVINIPNVQSPWIVFPLGISPTGKEYLIQHGSGTFPTGLQTICDVCLDGGVSQTISFDFGPDCQKTIDLVCPPNNDTISCDSLEIVLISPTVQNPDSCSYAIELTNNNAPGAIHSIVNPH